jgi:hypothetical protein
LVKPDWGSENIIITGVNARFAQQNCDFLRVPRGTLSTGVSGMAETLPARSFLGGKMKNIKSRRWLKLGLLGPFLGRQNEKHQIPTMAQARPSRPF